MISILGLLCLVLIAQAQSVRIRSIENFENNIVELSFEGQEFSINFETLLTDQYAIEYEINQNLLQTLGASNWIEAKYVSLKSSSSNLKSGQILFRVLPNGTPNNRQIKFLSYGQNTSVVISQPCYENCPMIYSVSANKARIFPDQYGAILLSGSELGVTYKLKADNRIVMTQLGTGSPLMFKCNLSIYPRYSIVASKNGINVEMRSSAGFQYYNFLTAGYNTISHNEIQYLNPLGGKIIIKNYLIESILYRYPDELFDMLENLKYNEEYEINQNLSAKIENRDIVITYGPAMQAKLATLYLSVDKMYKIDLIYTTPMGNLISKCNLEGPIYSGNETEKFSIKLFNSQYFVKYKLYLNETEIASLIGNGNDLEFNNLSELGKYTIKGYYYGQYFDMNNAIIITNVVKSHSYLKESTYFSKNKPVETYTYYDDLGRVIQKRDIGLGGSGKDIITPIYYDSFGRESKKYLSFSITDHLVRYLDDGLSKQNLYFTEKFGANHYAYFETLYNNCPDDQIIEQSSYGEKLKMGGCHTTKTTIYKYGGGDDIKKYRLTDPNSSDVTLEGKYTSYELMVKRTINTEGVNYSEYYDLQENLVCKSMAGVKTYYVYDDLKRQRYIISPLQDSEFSSGSKTLDQLSKLCYYTEYNELNMPYKQYVPGSGYTICLYDKRGRVAFSQDAKMRSQTPAKWSFIKYDELDRPIITGICGGDESTHRAALSVQTTFGEVRGNAIHGYTNNAYPIIANAEDCLTVIYHDDYTWLGISDLQFSVLDSFGVAKSDRIKGQITGMKNKILGKDASGWITSVTYYDKDYNVIQMNKQLYPSGVEITSNLHNFSREVIQLRVKQTVAGVTNEYTRYLNYDDFGRLLSVEQKITGDNVNNKVTLASYTYDDLGRVSEKNIHNNIDPTTYSYDVAGRQIAAKSANFSYELGFENVDPDLSGKVTPRYNGNISHVKWGNSNSVTNLYSYTYDQLSQLESAQLLKKTGTVWNSHPGFAEKNIIYDVNGNITSLTRSNSNGTETALQYTYNGNQVSKINNGPPYVYDAMGNMTSDGLKGVTIDYNILSLPQTISVGNVEKVFYIYTSAGEKLATKVGGSLTYYRGSFVYSGSELGYMIHPEGLIRKPSGSYVYYYTKTDHVGSTRLLCHANGTTMVSDQTTDYYPYGLSHSSENLNLNRYLYNGKELQDQNMGDKMLGLYDFGSRMYDPVVGRWFNVDPKLQFVNPYSYCANNPILYVDPNGEDIVLYFDNNVSITVTTNLVNVHITVPKGLGLSDKIKGNIRIDGDGVLLAALDIVGILDPTGVADMLAASMYASQKDIINAAVSGMGLIPYIGDFAKSFRIKNQFKILSMAVETSKPAGAAGKGFRSFDSFKNTMGSAGAGLEWHHIVGQNQYNIAQFGAEAIHNTDNLTKLPTDIHRKISGHYSSKSIDTGGQTVRDWQKTQSFEAQSKYGREIIEKAKNGKL